MEDYKKIVIRAERGPNGEYTTLDGKLITAPSYCKYVRSIDELSKRERQTYPIYIHDTETVSKVERK
jgi:hypothetical protein